MGSNGFLPAAQESGENTGGTAHSCHWNDDLAAQKDHSLERWHSENHSEQKHTDGETGTLQIPLSGAFEAGTVC